MSRKDTLRRIDQPLEAISGTSVTTVMLRGGGAGRVSDADTVDGFHAAAVPTAGRLLALNAAAQFPASVIDWTSVAGVGLQESPADKLAVKLDANSGLAVSASGLKLNFGGGNPTAIEPDNAAGQGTQPYAARADHRHAIAAAAPTMNLSVTSANAEGSATSFARSDHTHAINTSSNPGAAASILASSAQGYLQLVRLGLGVAPSYPLQVQGTMPQLRLQQDANHYADFEVAGDGDLTIQPSGDSLLVPSGKTLASSNWISQTTGWGIYPESTHGRDGYADFRYIYADELHVKAFITDLEQALAGGQIISKSVAILAADFTIPAKGASATLVVEDLPGTTAYVFANNDWVRIRNISRSGGGLVVADAYGTVTQVSQNGDGTQTYTFRRAAADTGSAVAGTVVRKGGLVLDYGVSGNGYWEVTTLDPAGSPYAQVATWAGHPQNLTVHARLGNLDGIAGIGAEWGLWAGKDSNHWIKVSDAGAEIKGLKQTWIDAGGNTRGMVDPAAGAGDYLFWLGPSSGNKRFGVTGDGTVYIGNVPSQNIAGWAHASDLTKIDGGNIYAGTITAQQVTLAPHNMVANASFEIGSGSYIPGWIRNQLNPRISTLAHTGSQSITVTANGVTNTDVAHQEFLVSAGDAFYFEGWMRQGGSPPSDAQAGYTVRWLDSDGTLLRTDFFLWTSRYTWSKRGRVLIAPPNAVKVRIYLDVRESCDANTGVNWDDVVFMPASSVGLHVYDPAGAGGYIRIQPEEIAGFDSSDEKQFSLRSTDGRATFGGGKGVLDASGLTLSGAETSWRTYNSVRWLTATNPPGGNQVAELSAGLFAGGQPTAYLVSNPGGTYSSGLTALTAWGSGQARAGSVSVSAGGTSAEGVVESFGALGRAAIEVYSSDSGSSIFFYTRGNTYRGGVDKDGMWHFMNRVGIGTPIGTPPSFPLHIVKSSLEGIHIEHGDTTANRALVVTRRNAANNATLEWHQQFGTGDTPAWTIARVDRPDGSGSGFLTALSIGWNGDVYVAGTLSAEGFIDRTPYPDRDTALAAVRSLKQAEGKTGSLDHEALHEYVRARDKSGQTSRNLSATVSAQNVVIQELLRRIELLEKDRRVS